MLKKTLIVLVLLVVMVVAGAAAYFYGAYPKMQPAPQMTRSTPPKLSRKAGTCPRG